MPAKRKVIVVPDLLQDYTVLNDYVVLISLRYAKELFRGDVVNANEGDCYYSAQVATGLYCNG